MNHPTPEALATFIDGTADAATRAEVTEHIESCDDCLMIVGETARLMDEEGARPATIRRFRPWFLVAAAIAALVAGSTWILRERVFDPVSRLSRAVRSLESREVEGRLAGFDYAPLHRAREAGDSRMPSEAVAIARDIEEKNAPAVNDGRKQHAAGVAALVAGDTAMAVTSLQRAVELMPHSSVYWNDYAVSLAEAERFNEALAAAEIAISLDDRSVVARFNRALILTATRRSGEAVAAWDEYLRRDKSSPWAQEATRRRETLLRRPD